MKSFFSIYSSVLTLSIFGISTLSFPAIAAPQEVCVRTVTGDVACGTPVPKPSGSSQPAIETTIDSQTAYGVTYELKSCVRGTKHLVSCTLVLSSDKD